MASICGEGLPPTNNAAARVPLLSRASAVGQSRLSWLTSTPSAARSAAPLAAEAEPAGPRLTSLPARSATFSIVGAGKKIDLLRRQSHDEFELRGEGLVKTRRFSERARRHEAYVDTRTFHKRREIVGARIAQDGKHAKLGIVGKKGGEVRAEQRLGGGGLPHSETEPSFCGFRLRVFAREERDDTKTETEQNATQDTPPRSSLYAREAKKFPRAIQSLRAEWGAISTALGRSKGFHDKSAM